MRLLLVLLVFLAIPGWSLAQTANDFLSDVAPLELTPNYPSPGEAVTIKINDYRSSLFGAEIDWYINGTLFKEANNRREATIMAGAAGEETVVRVVLSLASGRQETLSTIIKPVYLDLIIEPQTHLPDFYQGRALPSIGSVVNVRGLVEGSGLSPSNLVYTWRLNQNVLEGGPIRGRNSTSFTVPLGKNMSLSLEVAQTDGTVIASRTVSLPSVQPEVYFYEVNSLYGISNRAINNGFNFISNSATLMAEPYYLDSNIFNNPSTVVWEIDGEVVQNPSSNPYEISLQKFGLSGQSSLEFLVRSTSELLQFGRANIDINY